MRFKVKATYFLDAANWREAEHIVENQPIDADQIESEPISKAPKDILLFAIAGKIEDEHRKIFFDDSPEDYKENVRKLKEKMRDWLDNALDEVISSNENFWG